MHPTTARARLHPHARIIPLLHVLTAHQPVCASQRRLQWMPMAAKMDLKLFALDHPALQSLT